MVRAYFAAAVRPPGDLFRRLVRHGPDAGDDDAVAAYLAERPAPPAWLDRAAVGRAQEWFARHGLHVFTALYAASLPTAYACHRGVQVLHLTARLETDARRRLNETAQFMLDVMRPGGLDPGGPGYQAARRVRLMHAAVRWLIETDQRVSWNRQALGVPVNQEDLLETLLTFTEIVFEVFDRTGVGYDPAEADDYLHLWSYVGELLGIRPDLLPLDRAASQALMIQVRRRQLGASEAGRVLTAALLGQARQALPPGLRGMAATTVRWYVGDPTADLLAVPPADWTRIMFGPLSDLTRRISAGKVHDRFLTGLSARFGRALLTVAVDAARGGDRARFAIPTELAGALGVREDRRGGFLLPGRRVGRR